MAHANRQAAAVKSLFKTDYDPGEVARLICQAEFPPCIEESLLAEIQVSPGRSAPAGGGDGTLQKWESFLSYGTERFWSQVMAEGGTSSAV